MATVIYSFCALTALVCALMLARGYKLSRNKLLYWGAWTFAGLTFSNVILIFDKIIFPEFDLTTFRLAVSAIALLPLIYGLVFDWD
jgi:hypothetical protein